MKHQRNLHTRMRYDLYCYTGKVLLPFEIVKRHRILFVYQLVYLSSNKKKNMDTFGLDVHVKFHFSSLFCQF